MALTLYGYRRNLAGQGCACGLACFLNRRAQMKHSADRTTSYRHRSGSRRNKKQAHTIIERRRQRLAARRGW